MKILCIYQSPNMPSSRIRILQMLPWLEGQGVQADHQAYPETSGERREMFRRISHYDLVWLQKKMPNFFESIAWKRCTVPVVFDFDDAICFRKDPKNGSYNSVSRMRKFKAVLSSASGITCGNRYLASLASQQTASPLMIYPSPVPTDVPVRNYSIEGDDRRVLGWIGGRGNLDSLASIATELADLNRLHPFSLKVVSDAYFSAPGLTVENVPWSLETQEEELTKMDVGLMPLDISSPFDKGKCSYKLLQYMAAGVAVMADGVGMNNEVVQHGVNGQLAMCRKDYVKILAEMIGSDYDRLAIMGKEGRLLVENKYSYEKLAIELARFFNHVVRDRIGHNSI